MSGSDHLTIGGLLMWPTLHLCQLAALAAPLSTVGVDRGLRRIEGEFWHPVTTKQLTSEGAAHGLLTQTHFIFILGVQAVNVYLFLKAFRSDPGYVARGRNDHDGDIVNDDLQCCRVDSEQTHQIDDGIADSNGHEAVRPRKSLFARVYSRLASIDAEEEDNSLDVRLGKHNRDANQSHSEDRTRIADLEGQEFHIPPRRWCRLCNAMQTWRTKHCYICNRCVMRYGEFIVVSRSPPASFALPTRTHVRYFDTTAIRCACHYRVGWSMVEEYVQRLFDTYRLRELPALTIADHHCHFLSTCIGHRNYATFVTFIAYETLADAYMMRTITSLLSARPADYFVKDYLLLVVIVVNAATVMLLSLLSLTHIYLSLTNQTTYELFGYRIWYLPPAAGDRPFDSGHPLTNLRSAFCWRGPLRHVMYTDSDVGPRASADRLVRTRRPSIWSNKYYNCIG